MRTTSYNIPIEDRDFFTLLRIGLWQKIEEPLSEHPDWAYIFRLACEQTVQGVVADGLMLYEDYATEHHDYARDVDEDVKERFLDHAASIVYRNTLINQKQEEITNLFRQQHLLHYVVKGQIAAANYPKPNLRCPGDIDILIRPTDFSRTRDFLAPIVDKVDNYDSYMQHQQFYIDDIEIELHGTLRPCLGSRIDKAMDSLQQDLFDGTCNYETFSAIFIFLHALQHFHWSGLGLRQICDWTMFLHAKRSEIDFKQVSAAINLMKVPMAWNTFLLFAIDWLAMPATDEYNIPSKSYATSKLWQCCCAKGNMGHKSNKPVSSNIIKRNFATWKDIIVSSKKAFSVSPRTSIIYVLKQLGFYGEAFVNKMR